MKFCWRLGLFGFTLSGYYFLALAMTLALVLALAVALVLALLRPKNSAYVSMRGPSHVPHACRLLPGLSGA